jgi:hypothetical protein
MLSFVEEKAYCGLASHSTERGDELKRELN